MSTIRTNQWGLFDKAGLELITFSSVLAVEVTDEGVTTSEPVEEGSFATYNKNNAPLEVMLTAAIDGEPDELQAAIQTLREAKAGTALYSVITPEAEFANMNIENVSFRRVREDGVNVILFELRLKEVREVSPRYTTTRIKRAAAKNSDNVSTSNTGKKQTEEIKSTAYKWMNGELSWQKGEG